MQSRNASAPSLRGGGLVDKGAGASGLRAGGMRATGSRRRRCTASRMSARCTRRLCSLSTSASDADTAGQP